MICRDLHKDELFALFNTEKKKEKKEKLTMGSNRFFSSSNGEFLLEETERTMQLSRMGLA
jgi:hypothetical protein